MAGPDRRNAIESQTAVTGLDFVYVHPDQVTLDIFFLVPPLALNVPLGNLTVDQVAITGEQPSVSATALAWTTVDNRDVLRITCDRPGGFSPYTLRVVDDRIDPFFNGLEISFKVDCPSNFDCQPPPHECPPETAIDVATATLARDFWSFRGALLDFASQRYPGWLDRLEADVGVMLVEVMAALGDEMAYYQDRIGRETALERASQRRSLRRHARLVDYVVHDGLGARGWLDVQASAPGLLPAGTDAWAEGDGGGIIPFEIGRGLDEVLALEVYAVDPARNLLVAHLWDEGATCLAVGATEVHVDGHHTASLPLDDTPPGRPPGRWVVLQTDPADPSLPARRHVVRLIAVTDEVDPLGAILGTSTDVTRLIWEAEQALPFEMDLETFTVHANLVPVTAGRTRVEQFSIGPSLHPEIPGAVERTGANGSTAYLHTLSDPDGDGLVWLGTDPRRARPEIHVAEATPVGPSTWTEGDTWQWRRALVGVRSSQPREKHVTFDDGTWTRVAGYQRIGGEIVHVDYRSGDGLTLRFGDGEFGAAPLRGTATLGDERFFQATYRVGNGARSNVAAGTIRHLDPAIAFVASVVNPLPAAGGQDPETAAEVKRDAPEAFRAVTFRAVRPEDYAEAAERLPWVQRAGATFRWTGSWLSAFVAADPKGASELSPARRVELGAHLDRFRQTGREVHVLGPDYLDLDVEITVCVEPHAYAGDIEEAVVLALVGKRGVRPVVGFFDPDHFTFGTPLDRSELEAAVQRVAGVRAVEVIRLRSRGRFDWRPFAELMLTPGMDQVIRVDADPDHPDRGTLRVITEGGA